MEWIQHYTKATADVRSQPALVAQSPAVGTAPIEAAWQKAYSQYRATVETGVLVYDDMRDNRSYITTEFRPDYTIWFGANVFDENMSLIDALDDAMMDYFRKCAFREMDMAFQDFCCKVKGLKTLDFSLVAGTLLDGETWYDVDNSGATYVSARTEAAYIVWREMKGI